MWTGHSKVTHITGIPESGESKHHELLLTCPNRWGTVLQWVLPEPESIDSTPVRPGARSPGGHGEGSGVPDMSYSAGSSPSRAALNLVPHEVSAGFPGRPPTEQTFSHGVMTLESSASNVLRLWPGACSTRIKTQRNWQKQVEAGPRPLAGWS